MARINIEDRFFRKVKFGDSCWEWQAGKNSDKYGVFSKGGKCLLAHRVAWEIQNGPIPDGACVLHRCDNTVCVRGDHLFLGSQIDNINDRVAKGRTKHGPGPAKITFDDVITIRKKHKNGVSARYLSTEFGISKSQVHNIVNHLKWKFSGAQDGQS